MLGENAHYVGGLQKSRWMHDSVLGQHILPIYFFDTASCVNESPKGFPHKTLHFKRNEGGPEDLPMERRQVGIFLMMWKKDLTMSLPHL